MEKLRMDIENFRAIKKASIRLDGITILSGENGCGKSTISKLFYYYIKNNLEYKQLLYGRLFTLLGGFLSTLSRLIGDHRGSNFDEGNDSNIHLVWMNQNSADNIQETERLFFTLLVNAKNDINGFVKSKEDFLRIKEIVVDASMHSELEFNRTEVLTIDDLFTYAESGFRGEFIKIAHQYAKRDASVFRTAINRDFRTESLPAVLFELGIPLVNDGENKLNNIYTADKLFYIDTPMLFPSPALTSGFTRHWRDLSFAVRQNSLSEFSEDETFQLNDTITQIINGEVTEDKSAYQNVFQYTRKDGLTIDLRESATGIRAFAILELLLTKGLLNNKTLLLIDEPEAHLHPQWVVEYARIIIALNKELGVKFLLASHSPDMISALRYISEKEGTLDQLNFYLAEKEERSYQYTYKHLGTEIDEIFESFNIAMDRISLYGV